MKLVKSEFFVLGKEILRWVPDHNGKFSVKSAYNCIMKEINGTGNAPFPWKDLWKINLPRKIKYHLWKCLHDCVSMRSKISRFVADISSECPFCKQEVETANHLFINCDVTKRIWFSLDANIAGSISNVILQGWIASWFHTSNVSKEEKEKYTQFVSFAIWHIWKLRCSVIFDNGSIQVSQLVAQVNKDIVEWNENSLKYNIARIAANQTKNIIPWKMPDIGFNKINFDAAYLKKNNYMGIGLILFSDAGKFVGAQSFSGIAQDEEQAEALAGLAAIKWARDSAVEKLHLEGDRQSVVIAINGDFSSIR
ncbi:uncharacterized protein LOC113306354 [Papaver somniferum]|uniref:uncharacterized protein LOC113306354 n=1 Tax=Papaver somniferum TaxID=3469 RepID=UPI000E6F4A50|nr:uncharacterized protein LOC113306354 [Papaver somniferum]